MTVQTLTQMSRFAGVGAVGFIVDAGLTLGLIATGLDPFSARAVAIVCAMLVTWRLNRIMTFGASYRRQSEEGLLYMGVATAVALFNYGIYSGLILMIPIMPPLLAIMVAVVAATGLSFFGYRNLVFSSAE